MWATPPAQGTWGQVPPRHEARDSRHETPRILQTCARTHEQRYRGRTGRLARLGKPGRAKRERQAPMAAAQRRTQTSSGVRHRHVGRGPPVRTVHELGGQPRSDFFVGEIGGFWQMVLKWSPQKVRKTTCVPGKRSDNGELPQAREARLGEHTVISRPHLTFSSARSWNGPAYLETSPAPPRPPKSTVPRHCPRAGST